MGHVRSCHTLILKKVKDEHMYFKHGILNQTNMFHNIFFFIADSPSVVMDMPPTGGSQWFELITGSNPVAN